MQTVVITGGAGGIGHAICRTLARDGFGIGCIDPASCEDLASDLSAAGGRFMHFAVDAADRKLVEDSVDRVEREMGPLWGLVNCAGVDYLGPFLDTPDGEWERIWHINVKTAYTCSQVVGRRLVERRQGRIVNILSTSSFLGYAGLSAYDTSKGALQQMTRTMAIELGPLGVQVNGVAPGTVLTKAAEPYLSKHKVVTHELERTPMGRLGRPEDIAEAVAFLISPRATWINGATLVVDGGLSITGSPVFSEATST